MELTKQQVNITKGLAILFMIFLHLFCRKDIAGYYNVFFNINGVPLIYYLSLFCDSCVVIYCFCSGYGLLIGYKHDETAYFKKNLIRLFKLYINYWIILAIFVLGIGFILGKTAIYPGNFIKFFLTLTAISPAYNGAWWFVTTYIILVLCSPFINRMIIKYNSKIVILFSILFYFVSYVQRFKGIIVVDNLILNWFVTQLALFGTSQFPFIVGGVFADKKIYSKMYSIFNKLKFGNLISMSLIVAMIIFHSFVETLFIAPFIGIVFICLFNLMAKPNWLMKLLTYFSVHSTNIWLTHMFFYRIFFKEVVFYPQYPIFIFPWLILLCLVASYIVNFIYNPIINLLENKFSIVISQKSVAGS